MYSPPPPQIILFVLVSDRSVKMGGRHACMCNRVYIYIQYCVYIYRHTVGEMGPLTHSLSSISLYLNISISLSLLLTFSPSPSLCICFYLHYFQTSSQNFLNYFFPWKQIIKEPFHQKFIKIAEIHSLLITHSVLPSSSLTHALALFLSRSPTHSIGPSLTYSFTHSLPSLLTHSSHASLPLPS